MYLKHFVFTEVGVKSVNALLHGLTTTTCSNIPQKHHYITYCTETSSKTAASTLLNIQLPQQQHIYIYQQHTHHMHYSARKFAATFYVVTAEMATALTSTAIKSTGPTVLSASWVQGFIFLFIFSVVAFICSFILIIYPPEQAERCNHALYCQVADFNTVFLKKERRQFGLGRHKILSKVAVFYVGLNSYDHAKVTQKIDQMQVVIQSLEHIHRSGDTGSCRAKAWMQAEAPAQRLILRERPSKKAQLCFQSTVLFFPFYFVLRHCSLLR